MLGERLFDEPVRSFEVFESYVRTYGRKKRLANQLFERYYYPDPRLYEEFSQIEPRDAVRDLYPLISKIRSCLYRRPRPAIKKAKELLSDAEDILERAQRSYRRGRGHPREMETFAVWAYFIRKFNPHASKAGESSIPWAKLADRLFLRQGKCSRCALSKHQYNSPCVKALQTAVGRLASAMKDAGIRT